MSYMKRLIFLLLILLFLIGCDTPSKIIETYKTDSLGHTTKTVQKFYSDSIVTIVPNTSVNVVTTPFFWNNYGYPYYGYPYYSSPYFYHPRVVVPIKIKRH